jgi:hypothetical protein
MLLISRLPFHETNLHEIMPNSKNLYEQIMDAVLKRIDQYNPNATDYHLIGYGHGKDSSFAMDQEFDHTENDMVVISNFISSIKQKYTTMLSVDQVLSKYREAIANVKFNQNMRRK